MIEARRATTKVATYPPLAAHVPFQMFLAWCETSVSNVSLFGELPVGATVLDFGYGSGTETLVAAHSAAPSGNVIGVDFGVAMLARARQAVAQSGVCNAEIRESDAERLPMGDGVIDVAIVNGIFNLNPTRDAIFRELARVIKIQSVCRS